MSQLLSSSVKVNPYTLCATTSEHIICNFDPSIFLYEYFDLTRPLHYVEKQLKIENLEIIGEVVLVNEDLRGSDYLYIHEKALEMYHITDRGILFFK